jgi:hypothetical protein
MLRPDRDRVDGTVTDNCKGVADVTVPAAPLVAEL